MSVPGPEALEGELVLPVVAGAAVFQNFPGIVELDPRILADRLVRQVVPQLGLLDVRSAIRESLIFINALAET